MQYTHLMDFSDGGGEFSDSVDKATDGHFPIYMHAYK